MFLPSCSGVGWDARAAFQGEGSGRDVSRAASRAAMGGCKAVAVAMLADAKRLEGLWGADGSGLGRN